MLSDAQAGFRKGHSTVDHIFTLHASIEKQFARHMKLYVAFIDFKKAYDTVNRHVLWTVLMNSGVNGRMLKTLQAMYETVQACVLNNNEPSRLFTCLQGLKQGCVASPILFSLLINKLANEIITNGRHGIHFDHNEMELFVLLFVDDLTLLASTVIGLQNQLNVLHRSAERLCLTVNLDKSKIIVFRKGGFLASREKWVWGNVRLEVVNTYKYLGLTFSTGHSFTSAMEDTAIRAKKNTVEILKTLRRTGCVASNIFFKLFDSQIVPMLLYSAEIWGYKRMDLIERVHLFACKRFLHVRNRTTNDIVYGELGRYPLYINTLIRFVKFWFRLLKQPDNFYSKKAYKMLLNLHNNGSKNWVSQVELALCENGFEQVWLFGCGDEKRFCTEMKERLISSFCFNWQNHLDSSARLNVYSSIKRHFGKEKYITCLWRLLYRNALGQFRMGVSQINVHKFRFSTTEDHFVCPFCTECRETEIHFLFVCPTYAQIRSKFLSPVHDENNLDNKLVEILSSTSENEIVATAKYIFFSLKLRESLIDNNV